MKTQVFRVKGGRVWHLPDCLGLCSFVGYLDFTVCHMTKSCCVEAVRWGEPTCKNCLRIMAALKRHCEREAERGPE